MFIFAETVIFLLGLVWLAQMVWLLWFLIKENMHEDRPRKTVVSLSDFYVARGTPVNTKPC
jgi:hypothetical protein